MRSGLQNFIKRSARQVHLSGTWLVAAAVHPEGVNHETLMEFCCLSPPLLRMRRRRARTIGREAPSANAAANASHAASSAGPRHDPGRDRCGRRRRHRARRAGNLQRGPSASAAKVRPTGVRISTPATTKRRPQDHPRRHHGRRGRPVTDAFGSGDPGRRNAGPDTEIIGFTIRNGDDGISNHADIHIAHNYFTANDDAIDNEGGGGLCEHNMFEKNTDDAVDYDEDSRRTSSSTTKCSTTRTMASRSAFSPIAARP